MNVILLLEIFTRTYIDIYKCWNYLLMFTITSIFCIVMGCACRLVIKENDDDDDVIITVLLFLFANSHQKMHTKSSNLHEDS